jgi:hypothetical protein
LRTRHPASARTLNCCVMPKSRMYWPELSISSVNVMTHPLDPASEVT